MERCPFCQREIDPATPRSDLRWEEIGWSRERVQGGTNALELRKRTGTVAHSSCVQRAKIAAPGQGSLWSG